MSAPLITAAQQPADAMHHEPLPLSRELDPPTPYPVEALGPIGAAVVEEMHAIIQAPKALIAQSILAAMNQAAQPHANVIIDGRVSPLSDFFLTLGESGERKSAADGWSLALIRERQRTQMAKYWEERAAFEQAAQVHDTATKQILADRKLNNEAKQAKLAELPRPQAPVMPLHIVSEPSTEAIQRQLIIGLPAIGLVNDEGGQFLGGYSMSAEKRLGTLTTLSRLWDRGEFDRVRIGDGSGSYYGRRLTLHLMVQPGVASLLLADPLAREQGFLARCLVTYPASTAGQRTYVEANLGLTRAYQDYSARMQALLDAEWPVNERNELQPPNIVLAPPAKRLWIHMHDEIEAALGRGGYLAPVRPLASKAPEHITRIAGTFAVFEDTARITEAHIERAGLLIQHYLNEALRLWGAGQVSADLKIAQELLDWLRERYAPGQVFTLATIYRNGPSAIRSAAAARRVMQILAQHRWCVSAEHPSARDAFMLVGV